MTDNLDMEPASQAHLLDQLRWAPRSQEVRGREMAVVVRRGEEAEEDEVRGRILDLSLVGAKLELEAEISLRETIQIRLDLDESSVDLTMTATVCWCRTAGDAWRLGCAFEEELPESLIRELSLRGYANRRQAHRHAVSAPATIQWELTQDTTPIRLRNLSNTGFCMVCPSSPPEAARCRLIMDGPEGETVTIPASVRWQHSTTDGYLVGCEYLEPDVQHVIERAVLGATGEQANDPMSEPSSQPEAEPKPRVAATSVDTSKQWIDTLDVTQAARWARRRLVLAALTIVGAFGLLELSRSAGTWVWGLAVLAMLAAAAWTVSYHRLTILVLDRAAKAGEDRA